MKNKDFIELEDCLFRRVAVVYSPPIDLVVCGGVATAILSHAWIICFIYLP